ncbi:hypothetical protein D3C72_2346600 [compost metagenome]
MRIGPSLPRSGLALYSVDSSFLKYGSTSLALQPVTPWLAQLSYSAGSPQT